MQEKMIAMYVAVQTAVYNFKHKEKGAVDIVAVVILIAVAIGLGILFRKQISSMLEGWLNNIRGQGDNAITQSTSGTPG